MPPIEEKQVPLRTVLLGLLVVALLGIWLAWWQGGKWIERMVNQRVQDQAPLAVGAELAKAPPPEQDSLNHTEDAIAALERRWSGVFEAAPSWPADFEQPADCEAIDQNLAAVCREIDNHEGIGQRIPSAEACGWIEEVGDVLARKAPSPSSELKSLTTVLNNVFHLSRVLGRKRAIQLRDAIAEDPELQEIGALAVYRWLASRETCARRSAIGTRPLYDYSAFLLQTMGGQAYLRRRSPKVEALTTFYALVLLDRAIERGINPHGIDPRRDLERCRNLIEAQPLLFGEQYVAVLDDMQARWDQRGRTR